MSKFSFAIRSISFLRTLVLRLRCAELTALFLWVTDVGATDNYCPSYIREKWNWYTFAMGDLQQVLYQDRIVLAYLTVTL